MEATNGNTVWTEENIETLLKSNNRAVEKAIVAIYKRQTEDEKATQATRHSNNVGFSGADASRGTYYAQWILSGKRLTGKHLDKGRAMALKYRKQLLSIANANRKSVPPIAPTQTPAVSASESGTYSESGVGDCDVCLQTKHGTTHYHMGVPVLFTCTDCDTKPSRAPAPTWVLTKR